MAWNPLNITIIHVSALFIRISCCRTKWWDFCGCLGPQEGFAPTTLSTMAQFSAPTEPVRILSSFVHNMQPMRVGVLALQGSFREHMSLLQRIPGVEVIEVRSKEELATVAGLIIPGGACILRHHRPPKRSWATKTPLELPACLLLSSWSPPMLHASNWPDFLTKHA